MGNTFMYFNNYFFNKHTLTKELIQKPRFLNISIVLSLVLLVVSASHSEASVEKYRAIPVYGMEGIRSDEASLNNYEYIMFGGTVENRSTRSQIGAVCGVLRGKANDFPNVNCDRLYLATVTEAAEKVEGKKVVTSYTFAGKYKDISANQNWAQGVSGRAAESVTSEKFDSDEGTTTREYAQTEDLVVTGFLAETFGLDNGPYAITSTAYENVDRRWSFNDYSLGGRIWRAPVFGLYMAGAAILDTVGIALTFTALGVEYATVNSAIAADKALTRRKARRMRRVAERALFHFVSPGSAGTSMKTRDSQFNALSDAIF